MQGFITLHRDGSDMAQSEMLRCNVCGTELSSPEVKVHASTTTHTEMKHKLEQDLEATKNGLYLNDTSVIVQWKESV